MASIPPQYSGATPASATTPDEDPTPVTPESANVALGTNASAGALQATGPTTYTSLTSATADSIGSPLGTAATSVPLPRISVRGGNMAMRVFSRVKQDLDILTGGNRVASYDEVDEHVARRIAIEREFENDALKALGLQTDLQGKPASTENLAFANSPADGKSAVDQIIGGAGASGVEGANMPQVQVTTPEIGDEAAPSLGEPKSTVETDPATLPGELPSQRTFKGGKMGLTDWFQYTQSLASSGGDPADAAGPIGSGYFKGDETDIATAASIAKDTIAGADLARDFMNSNLTISTQYFEKLAAVESPYKSQYELIAQILDTKIALDTAALDQKLGHEGMAYAHFFGQVARHVSVPVDFAMTIKDLSDGTISPAEAAVALATMGHAKQLMSVERMVVKGAEKQIIEKAEQIGGERSGVGSNGTGGGGAGKGGKGNGGEGGGNGSEGGETPNGNARKPPDRQRILQHVEEVLGYHLDTIRKIAPDAKVGFRGSLASGVKGKHKGGGGFDAKDFDVDALIVSDRLFLEIPKLRRTWRSGSNLPALREIQDEIENALRSNPDFAGMRKKDKFTFRIYSEKEYNDLLKERRSDKSFHIRFIGE